MKSKTGKALSAAIVAAASLTAAVAFASPAQTTVKSILVHRSATSHRTTPPDSFLVYKVYSIDELINQVKASPRIQSYYARQFHVPQSRVLQYMEANLVESYIPSTRIYTCYCVRKNGLIYPVKQKFTEGTKVFALRNGEPVLKWVCGNPLSKFLPAVETHTIVKEMPVIKVAPSTEVVAPTDNVQVLVPTESQVVVTNASSDFDAIVPPSLINNAPEASNFVLAPEVGGTPNLDFLAFLPVIFAATHNGGGGGNGGNPNSNPTPVPEASTLVTSAMMLSAGAVFLGLRRRSARRS